MMRHLLFIFLGASLITLSSCGASEEQAAQISLNTAAEGPFFAGGNSLIATYTVDLSNLVEGRELTSKDIHSIGLSAVNVTITDDSISLADLNSITLQLVGDNAPMATVAVLNPIEGTGTSATLTASEEADLLPYFSESSFTVVLDLDLKEDAYVDELTSDVDLSLNVALK